MKTREVMTDIQTLRTRAREYIEEGAMTPVYKATPAVVIA